MPVETDPYLASRPATTVDIVLVTMAEGKLHVLVHKRAADPFKDSYALPGGYIHIQTDDSAESAAWRILSEKAGLPAYHLEQLATYSGPDRDPRGWSISVTFLALVPRGELPELDGDVVTLIPVDEISEWNLAFDHEMIIEDARIRMKGKSTYSTLPAALLNEPFTLRELHAAYEAMSGETFNRSNFGRKILTLGVLEETGERRQEGISRPALLYRLSGGIRAFDRNLGNS